jgi:hypothetical protein
LPLLSRYKSGQPTHPKIHSPIEGKTIMPDSPIERAHDNHLSEVLQLGAEPGGAALPGDALAALSEQANQIGMTGFAGGSERLALVAGKGLLHTPEGMVETVKREGALGMATTAVESAIVGFGLRALMTKAAPVAEVAALALGTSFVAKTVPQFWDAGAKALKATTWNEMDQASAKFSQATGSLAVDSIIGIAGYKLGSGGAGLTKWGNREGLAPAAAASSRDAAVGRLPLAALKSADEAFGAPDASSLAQVRKSSLLSGAPEALSPLDASGEVLRPLEKLPIVKSVVSPEHTISMRDLSERDPAKFDKILDEYYPKLQNAFPDASEIESKETYRDYLHDKDFPWDMLVLHDKGGNVLGGIQSQVVDVGGSEIQKAVWAEHIWLAPEARTYTNFQTLLKTGVDRWSATGSDVVFMEFNDRAKMSLAQQNDDAAAGLTPEAREKIWGRVGLYVLGDESGRVAPYAQPAMGDGAPVEYLSVGMAPLKGKTLDGKSVPIDDYLKLLQAAHSTIPEVNLESDPTVLKYASDLKAIKATGQDRLSFARLKDTEVLRLINQRFISIKPATAQAAE